jgi:PiT family inorganic phosphate transporter
MAPIILIAIAGLLGLYMAWNIGANDVANSMAAAVGSRSISVRNAIIAAGICEFAGAVLVGSHVTDTVRKGIVDPSFIAELPGLAPGEAAALMALGMTAALIAAALWLNIATWMGMPVSTTHSIVGAVAGFGIVAAGFSCVNWGKMGQIVLSWFISPVVGGILGFVLFKLISRYILGKESPVRAAIRGTPPIAFLVAVIIALATLYKGLKHVIVGADWMTGDRAVIISVVLGLLSAFVWQAVVTRRLKGKENLPLAEQLEEVEMIFAPLVIATSCCVAFAHGANDVANAIGPLAAVVYIIKEHTVDMTIPVPFWVLALGGAGIVIGLATYGYRVMSTVGTKITQITPSRGVAASIAATATVLVCTRMKLPVSTTHTLVGAIFGIGLARGLAAVNRQVSRDIFFSWLITVPAAAVLSILFFIAGRFFLLDTIRDVMTS